MRSIAAGSPNKSWRRCRRSGGILAAEDLTGYQAKIRKPVRTTFRGFDIYAPPPPSSGGIALVEMLGMLETFDLARLGRHSPEANHLIVEAMAGPTATGPPAWEMPTSCKFPPA